MTELLDMALQTGFTHAGVLDIKTIELRQDVRDMCAENLCGKFGKNWSCPPGCGSLEELKNRISEFRQGVLVQTVAQLEDEFDVETMLETERIHKKRFTQLYNTLRQHCTGVLALGVGCCDRCAQCTYPDAPCRFPEERIISMEACGLMVSQIVKDNGMQYYHGKNTITYTSCYLL